MAQPEARDATTMPRTTLRERVIRNRAVVAGLLKYFPGKTLVLDGKRITTDAFVATVRRHGAAMDDVARAKAVLRALVRDERSLEAKVHALVRDLHGFALNAVGSDPVVFTALGLAFPRKTGPKTAAAKAAGAAKGAITRKERGTVGKRQRAKLKR
jgi:hypothetical protein